MGLWDDILRASKLNECNSIAEHLCSALSNGSRTIFIKNQTFVSVKEKPILSVLSFINPKITALTVINKQIFVSVQNNKPIKVKVNKKPIINISIKCPN